MLLCEPLFTLFLSQHEVPSEQIGIEYAPKAC